jgi:hypothetical protein
LTVAALAVPVRRAMLARPAGDRWRLWNENADYRINHLPAVQEGKRKP